MLVAAPDEMKVNTTKPNCHIAACKLTGFKQIILFYTKGVIIQDKCEYMHGEEKLRQPFSIVHQAYWKQDCEAEYTAQKCCSIT